MESPEMNMDDWEDEAEDQTQTDLKTEKQMNQANATPQVTAVPKFNLRSTITLTPSPSSKQPHRKNTHRKTQSLQIDDEILVNDIVQSIEKERSSSFDETPNLRYEGSDSEDEIDYIRKDTKHVKTTFCGNIHKINKDSRTSTFYDALRSVTAKASPILTTDEKASAAKRFMHEFYYKLWSYHYRRAEDLSRIKEQISQGKISPQVAETTVTDFYRHHTNELRKKRSKIRRHDFQILAKIGKGGFGDVYLCRNVKTNAVFAMKRMKIAFIKAKNKTSHIQLEKDILSDVRSPWLVHLAYSFQDNKYVYLIMEYVPGGDMRGLLNNVYSLNIEEAKVYLAEMILAVLDLHKLNYVHRDLKPENFLIDKEGHIKLADFGLSKKGVKASMNFSELSLFTVMNPRDSVWRRKSASFVPAKHSLASSAGEVCGSPNYMAVEVLREKGYDEMIDFWSIGVIFFELLMGATPFEADTPAEVFANILNYKECMAAIYSEATEEILSPVVRDFLDKLICEPEVRIGRRGLMDFKSHKLFEGFNWEIVRDLDPPFTPKLSSETDVSYFDIPMDKKELSDVQLMNSFVMKHMYADSPNVGSPLDDYVRYKYEDEKKRLDLLKSI